VEETVRIKALQIGNGGRISKKKDPGNVGNGEKCEDPSHVSGLSGLSRLSGLSGQPRRPERPKELYKLNRRLAFPWIGFRRPEF